MTSDRRGPFTQSKTHNLAELILRFLKLPVHTNKTDKLARKSIDGGGSDF